jgi:hypothetical protein
MLMMMMVEQPLLSDDEDHIPPNDIRHSEYMTFVGDCGTDVAVLVAL